MEQQYFQTFCFFGITTNQLFQFFLKRKSRRNWIGWGFVFAPLNGAEQEQQEQEQEEQEKEEESLG